MSCLHMLYQWKDVSDQEVARGKIHPDLAPRSPDDRSSRRSGLARLHRHETGQGLCPSEPSTYVAVFGERNATLGRMRDLSVGGHVGNGRPPGNEVVVGREIAVHDVEQSFGAR